MGIMNVCVYTCGREWDVDKATWIYRVFDPKPIVVGGDEIEMTSACITACLGQHIYATQFLSFQTLAG